MERDLKNSELYEGLFHFREKRSNLRFIAVFFAVLGVLIWFRIYWANTFGGVEVDGGSMNCTLRHGDQLLMKRTAAGTKAERGDVIVVYVGDYAECASISSGYIIKRLIATEGDEVKCIDGQVYIMYAGTMEFVELDEPYAYYSQDKVFYDFDTYKVGEGEIFFLGDNRYNSRDSRYQQNSGSHLTGKLYKEKDIFGVVPQWAIENQEVLEEIFFTIPKKINDFLVKIKIIKEK